MLKVLTMGSFDILHYGHLVFLERCKDIAGEDGTVFVGLNTDEFIQKYRKRPPIMNYSERLLTLSKVHGVKYVVANDQADGTIKNLIEDYKPNLIVVGSDWSPFSSRKKEYLSQIGVTQEYLDSKGVGLCFIPYTESISSTEIKERAKRM